MHNNLVGATIFPHNIGLGATGDPDLVRLIVQITAIEVAATGTDWTFDPCITVPQDERWGRTYEGFSKDSELTAELGKAAIEGYQGDDFADNNTILEGNKDSPVQKDRTIFIIQVILFFNINCFNLN